MQKNTFLLNIAIDMDNKIFYYLYKEFAMSQMIVFSSKREFPLDKLLKYLKNDRKLPVEKGFIVGRCTIVCDSKAYSKVLTYGTIFCKKNYARINGLNEINWVSPQGWVYHNVNKLANYAEKKVAKNEILNMKDIYLASLDNEDLVMNETKEKTAKTDKEPIQTERNI